METLEGKDFMMYVTIGGEVKPVACATSMTINISRELKEATKPANSNWRQYYNGMLGYSVSVEGVFAFDPSVASASDFITSIISDNELSWVASDAKNPEIVMSGVVMQTSISTTTPADNKHTFSVSFTGTGPLIYQNPFTDMIAEKITTAYDLFEFNSIPQITNVDGNIRYQSYGAEVQSLLKIKMPSGVPVIGNFEDFEFKMSMTIEAEKGSLPAFEFGIFNTLRTMGYNPVWGMIMGIHGGIDNWLYYGVQAQSTMYFMNTNPFSSTVDITKPVDITMRKVLATMTIIVSQEGKPTHTKSFTLEDPPDAVKGISLMNWYGIRLFRGNYTISDAYLKSIDVRTENLFVGDSRTQSSGATLYANGYAQLVKQTFPKTKVFAGGSSRSWDIVDALPTIIKLKPKRVFLLIGVNDFTTSTPMSETKSNVQNIINTLTSAGIEPIWLRELPRAEATDLNTWFTVTFPAVKQIDTNTPMRASGDPNTINPSYSADGVHPNNAGYVVMKNAVVAAMTSWGY